MKELVDAIAAAVEAEATVETRIAGIHACRTILTALAASPAMPIPETAAAQPSPIASVIAALRGVPPDQLLDLAITKLRAALPADAEVPRVEPLKFHIVPLPRRG